MAIGDVIDIGGVAYLEVKASNTINQNPDKTYAPIVVDGTGVLMHRPISSEQISNAELASVVTLEPPVGANRAWIQNNGSQPARWNYDQDPGMMLGMILGADESITLDFGTEGLAKTKFMRTADGVTLDILWFT